MGLFLSYLKMTQSLLYCKPISAAPASAAGCHAPAPFENTLRARTTCFSKVFVW
jgi:hypothetical protein